ncbi:MAG: hypothetical protein HOV94_09345 [Saccharothrix sp.]|nr:hypothetical protein [Saccharothrix sp.]
MGEIAEADPGFTDNTVLEARKVLESIARWKLPAARWTAVAAAVDDAADAFATRDGVAFDKAVARLEQLSPFRVWRPGRAEPEPQAGTEPEVGVGEDLAERLVVLTDRLDDHHDR